MFLSTFLMMLMNGQATAQGGQAVVMAMVDNIIHHIVFLQQWKGDNILKIKRNSDAIQTERVICVFKLL